MTDIELAQYLGIDLSAPGGWEQLQQAKVSMGYTTNYQDVLANPAMMYGAGGDGTPPPRDSTVLPQEFWPSPEVYDRVSALMLARGITPPPIGTVDSSAQQLGRAMWQEAQDDRRAGRGLGSPNSVAAFLGTALLGGGAFGGAGAGGSQVGSATVSASNTAAGYALPTAGGAVVPAATVAPAVASGAGPAAAAATGFGRFIPAIIGGGLSLIQNRQAQNSIKDATAAQQAGIDRGLDFARESRDMAIAQQEPFRQASLGATRALMSMTGLPIPQALRDATTAAPGPGNTMTTQPYQGGLLGLAYGGSAPRQFAVSEYGHPERVYRNGNMEVYRKPTVLPGSNTGHVAPVGRGPRPLVGRALGGSITGYAPDSLLGWGDGSGKPFNGAYPVGGNTSTNPANPGSPGENPGGLPGEYNFRTDPGYQFRIGEGMRALENSAAARGGLLSGGFGRQALRYATDYSAQEYTNVYNRIANIAGMNQVAGPLQNVAERQYGNNALDAAMAGGANTASGYIGGANATASMLNQLSEAFGTIDWKNIFGND